MTADPATVPGLPESRLADTDLAALPASGPPAPWECRATAVLWTERARAPRFDWQGRPLPLAVAAFVDYHDTPVGPYREVITGAVLRDGRRLLAQVPFIAVDSLPSVLGGRANWALPKTMAWFDLDAAAGTGRATGAGWSVAVRPVRSRPPGRAGTRRGVPVSVRFGSTGPMGRYVTSMRARARPVLLRTEVTGGDLAGWLGSGRHLGLVLDGTFRIEAPAG